MRSRMRAALEQAGDWIPTCVVLAVLAALGWWGYANDWKMPKFAAQGSSAAEKGEGDDAKKEEDDKLAPIHLASDDSAAKAGIQTAEARLETINEYVTANGEVDYDQNWLAHLSSRAAGTVWSVEKQAGEKVKKGEVLAVISSADVGKAKGEFLNALVQYHIKDKQLERTQAAGESIPERQLREAEAQMREARVKLFGDQQTLLNLGLPVRLEDFLALTDDQAKKRLRVLGLPDSVLGKVDTATVTSNLLPLTAPFDSTIVHRDIVVGEPVSTSAMHFTVADLRQVWVMLYVRLEDVGRLRREQEVIFSPDGGPEKPSGRLAWISDEVDEKTHRVPVRVDFPNSDGQLRPHTFGTGRIIVGQHPGVRVPKDAVQWDVENSRHLVFIRESARVYLPRVVKVLSHDGERTEVSDLRGGEIVAATGSHALKSEMLKARIGDED